MTATPATLAAAVDGRRFETREAWLLGAIEALRPLFAEIEVEVPAVRVSVGWPGGRGKKGTVIGQCWPGLASEDGMGQIFISPILNDPARILDVLAHELIHAVNHAAGQNGHGADFARIAKPLGLTGKMTATVASEDLAARLAEIAEVLGAFPHAAMVGTLQGGAEGPKKQGTRMLKVECAQGLGYKVRMTRSWIEEVGFPICPCHGEEMVLGA